VAKAHDPAASRLLLATLVLSAGTLAGLSGCSSAPAEAPAPPPTVTASHPLQKEVTDFAEFTGRTAAVDSLEVRARVTGYLERIYFTEGTEVKEGDLLYLIDPRPYQAAFDQAEAQLRLQEAQLRYQEAVFKREAKLYATGGVATEEYEQALEARQTALATVKTGQAQLESARLNLGFTQVKAAITGLLGRTLITRGNLVVADQTLLTTIVSLDPMYTYFDVDEQTLLRVQKLVREGKFRPSGDLSQMEPSLGESLIGLIRSGEGLGPLLALSDLFAVGLFPRVPLYLGLANEQGSPHLGRVDFVNNQLSTSTSTLQVRGIFPNPKPGIGPRLLSPGLFVRVRVPIGSPYKALLVIQGALLMDQNLVYVFVVNDQNKVERRDVKLGTDHDGLTVITEGLKATDRVIVEGIQHVRQGIVVNAKLEAMPVPDSSFRAGGAGTKRSSDSSSHAGSAKR
jgi:RND family efflux transporter MFP subunit